LELGRLELLLASYKLELLSGRLELVLGTTAWNKLEALQP
jgi:hypothetical protein